MSELVERLRQAATQAIEADVEVKDKLNHTSGQSLKTLERAWFVATQRFFKILDWHGEYGEEIRGPQKIVQLCSRITALEQENARLKSEHEAICAAALNEAAEWHKEREIILRDQEKHLLKHFGRTQASELLHREIVCHVGSANSILALATMPQGYSVVETPREFICEKCHLRIEEGVKPECNF
jgi:hypothetical protein